VPITLPVDGVMRQFCKCTEIR